MWLSHRGHTTPSLLLTAAPVSRSLVCTPCSGDPPPQPLCHLRESTERQMGSVYTLIRGKEETKKAVNVKKKWCAGGNLLQRLETLSPVPGLQDRLFSFRGALWCSCICPDKFLWENSPCLSPVHSFITSYSRLVPVLSCEIVEIFEHPSTRPRPPILPMFTGE